MALSIGSEAQNRSAKAFNVQAEVKLPVYRLLANTQLDASAVLDDPSVSVSNGSNVLGLRSRRFSLHLSVEARPIRGATSSSISVS